MFACFRNFCAPTYRPDTLKIHINQLGHVKRGCLQRVREDIAADGSRIEGSHKGWNMLQRAFASGLEMWLALASDFVLRRNVRITYKLQGHSGFSAFISTTHGCHHLRLCNSVNQLYNLLIEKEAARGVKIVYIPRALMKTVDSGETFGLVRSENALTFSGLWDIKEEPDEEEKLEDILADPSDMLDSSVVAELNLSPASFYRPLLASSFDTPSSDPKHALFLPTHMLSVTSGDGAASVSATCSAPLLHSPMASTVADSVIDPQLRNGGSDTTPLDSAFTFQFPIRPVTQRIASASSVRQASTSKEKLAKGFIVSRIGLHLLFEISIHQIATGPQYTWER